MTGFAERLRQVRVAGGLTQEQLGFAIGVTKSSISAWENGRETPSFHLLPRLSSALHRSLDELLCGTPSAREPAAESGYLPGPLDERERTLLLRFRRMPARHRAALLALMKPWPVDPEA